MTDANLMDANCSHGEVWYECALCESIDRDYWASLEEEGE